MQDVTIVRSRHRRSVAIQILPDASVKVTVPFLYPMFFVNRFLKEKESWILEKQAIMRARKKSIQDDGYYYLGIRYPLAIRVGQKELVVVEDKMYLGSSNKKYTTTYLTSWYKQQARKIIVQRVAHYAALSGDTYRSVSITSADTRWGSCSSQKTLNFNWKLVMAPMEVIDYVVAHELSHLTQLNHSHAFWERVRRIYPLYREYRTWLKRHGHLLTV